MHRDDKRLFAELAGEQRPVLRIGTKADIGGRGEIISSHRSRSRETSTVDDRTLTSSATGDYFTALALAVSACSGFGLDELCDRIADALAVESRGQRQWLGMTAARCQDSLLAARDALSRTADAASLGLGDDLIVIELRDALEHLGHIVGAVYTDDLLDRIFSKFCIGK